jgi:hypothetical protein
MKNNPPKSFARDFIPIRFAYGTLDIVRGWQHFADGSGNRQKRESGQNGVNMRDYYWNNTWWFADAGFMETFLQYNCLQDQDDN